MLSWNLARGRYLESGIILLIIIFIVFVEPFNLQLTTNTFHLFGKGEAIKVVFIADTQDAYNSPDYFSHAIDLVNEQKPDLILIGGDHVETANDWDRLDEFSRLESKYGIYAVMGNHDYNNWDCPYCYKKLETKLESMNISVLRNENLILDIKGHRFALIGVDDLWVGLSDYDKASEGIPENMTKIIMAHNQNSMKGYELQGKNLILSGHTHCGVVQVPFVTDYVLQSTEFSDVSGGRATIDENTELYVTCGVTPSGVRLFTNPEISVIYLN